MIFEKKTLCLLLAATMLFCILSSCKEEPPPASSSLTLVEDEASEYSIVCQKGGDAGIRKLAIGLRDLIREATGVKLMLEEDPALDPEERMGEKALLVLPFTESGARSDGGYEIRTEGETIVFSVGSKTGAYFALCAFAKDCLGTDLMRSDSQIARASTLSIDMDWKSSREISQTVFPYLGADRKGLCVSYFDSDYMQKRMAIRLREQISVSTGEKPVFETYWSSIDTLDPDYTHLILERTEALQNGEWCIQACAQGLRIQAGDYHGFVSALRSLEDDLHEWGFYSVGADRMTVGSYLDTLDEPSESTLRYTYERQGEHRIIFNNVLFHNGTGTRPDQPADVPVEERNRLQAEMVALYRPDVFAIQEVAKSKRQEAGEDNLVTLLGDLGYVETVDPRVQNSKSVEEGGWGLIGEPVYDENGELLHYTNYNMDPIFYNTATTRCLESEYYWFKNHAETDASKATAGENSTKGSTWAVLESIETGERYIVVSAHLTGRNRTAQTLQAKELTAVIDRLIERYDCPAFFGGDMNGRVEHPYYAYLTGEGGFLSLQDQDGAEITSKIRTTHGYPRYDESLRIITDGGQVVAEISDGNDSIDKVYAKHLDDTQISLFGVIADECSLSASDHLPMLVDFSIGEP